MIPAEIGIYCLIIGVLFGFFCGWMAFRLPRASAALSQQAPE
jgi:hypothetical protein